MKDKIKNIILFFVMTFTMVMGFFLTYGLAWKLCDLPLNNQSMWILILLALVSEVCFILFAREK